MKQLATIVALLTLTACGGSDNPLAVVQDDPVQVQNSETIDSSPVLVPNMAISTPVVNQEPVQQPLQEQNNPVPVAGECIDTDPVNDGWGFNGATSCQLPIEPVVTPDCVGVGYGYGWENDASCVYVNQSLEIEPVNPPPVILPEPVVPDDEPVTEVEPEQHAFSSWIGRELQCFNAAGLMRFFFNEDRTYKVYTQSRSGDWTDFENGTWDVYSDTFTTTTSTGTAREWVVWPDGFLVNTDMMWSCEP